MFKNGKWLWVFVLLFAATGLGLFAVKQVSTTTLGSTPKISQNSRYGKWLTEEVNYIITEKETKVFLQLESDKDRDLFIDSFWKQRDPSPATPENEYKIEHYRRLQSANQTFGTATAPGWKTEAGRNYIVFGEANPWIMKMRIFEVARGEAGEPVKSVTSSYLKYSLTATIKTEFDLAEEMKQIQRTFNYLDVKLLTEADFNWKKGDRERAFHIFRLDGKEYLVLITPIEVIQKLTFRIEVYEQGEKAKINLLDTEFSIPAKNITVFGFEDTKGNVYFLSFRVSGWVPGTYLQGVTTVTTVRGEESVRASGEISPPRIIKQVDPVYPEIARQARIEGVVILEIRTDIYGRVQDAKLLRSIPLLDQAAIDAVKQWVYEPMIINGRPRGGIFTVTVRFDLKDKTAKAEQLKEGEPLRLTGGIEPPTQLKRVDPVYPEVARLAHVEGLVILEATTDIYGRAQNIKVLRSIPLLDQAAIDAVKQWVYEPVIINGKPIPVTFTVTVRFALDTHLKPAGVTNTFTFKLLEGMKPPKRTKYVEPIYPEEAIKAQVQGPVTLEAELDESGNMSSVKVKKSIPLLDKAAIDAVKQWKFEPALVAGKPKLVILTVTLFFSLNKEDKGEASGVLGGVVGGVVGEVPSPVKCGGDIKPPTILRQIDPVYPEAARQAGAEGIVTMEVLTDVYGRVQNVKVIKSISDLDQAAIDAVKQWIYEPLMMDGKPRPAIFVVTITFTLK